MYIYIYIHYVYAFSWSKTSISQLAFVLDRWLTFFAQGNSAYHRTWEGVLRRMNQKIYGMICVFLGDGVDKMFSLGIYLICIYHLVIKHWYWKLPPLIGKSYTTGWFSISMFVYQMVNSYFTYCIYIMVVQVTTDHPDHLKPSVVRLSVCFIWS